MSMARCVVRSTCYGKRVTYFAFLTGVSVLFLTLSCSRHKETAAATVDHFIVQVEATKPWESIAESETPMYSRAMDGLGNRFQKFSVGDAREIVKRLSELAMEKEKHGRLGDSDRSLSTVYVLLRYYFRVPTWDCGDGQRFFGGWCGGPKNDGRKVAVLWPLTENPDGSVHFEGACEGYLGEPYDALGEFNYFNHRYGVRCAVAQDSGGCPESATSHNQQDERTLPAK